MWQYNKTEMEWEVTLPPCLCSLVKYGHAKEEILSPKAVRNYIKISFVHFTPRRSWEFPFQVVDAEPGNR